MLLIVERDPRFLGKLKKHLNISGLRNFFVDSTRDALFLMKSMKCQFLLVNLGCVSTYDDLQKLADYSKSNQTPLLYIVGFKGTKELAKRIPVNKLVSTVSLPFTVSELSQKIELLRNDRDPMLGLDIGPSGHEVTLKRKLGAGAMGVVYEGYQRSLDRRVAVKVLSKNALKNDSDAGTRFQREARAMAQMRSPHVVQVYTVGLFGDTPYLTMEYIDGPNLEKYMRAKKILKIKEAIAICRQILLGLAEAHRRGKVHRDMKPANIMINKDGQAVILDFGLVLEDTSQNITRAGTVLGTPRYMAPEQVTGDSLGHRGDLYSLGVILFEMLIGEPPFKANDYVGVLMKHARDPLPRPEDFGKTLPIEIYRIIEKMTRKKPDQRYQSAEEIILDLDAFSAAMGPEISLEVDSETLTLNQAIQPIGGLTVNDSGTVVHRFGDATSVHGQILHIVNSLLVQIQDVESVGEFERGVLHLDSEKMLIFKTTDGLAGIETKRSEATSMFSKMSLHEIKKLFGQE